MFFRPDISGHYAEEQIKKLFECGVLSLNKGEDTFRPDDNITVGELADMLNSTFIRPIPIYLLNADAKSNDSGTEDSNNAITTRQDAAKAIIYAAGLEQAAKLRGIFTTGYYDEADINPEYLGSVALCRGMGVMSGDENNYFNPDRNPVKSRRSNHNIQLSFKIIALDFGRRAVRLYGSAALF